MLTRTRRKTYAVKCSRCRRRAGGHETESLTPAGARESAKARGFRRTKGEEFCADCWPIRDTPHTTEQRAPTGSSA